MKRDNGRLDLKISIDQRSMLSAEEQLVGQIKTALMLGKLNPGQVLPSVRALERQTGIGRSIIWRAYSKLTSGGALETRGRRHVVVSPNSYAQEANELVKVGNWLSRDILERLQCLGLNAHSFLRFLSHQVTEFETSHSDILFAECNRSQVQRFSDEISRVWDVPVRGVEIASLQRLSESERSRIGKVITPSYHYGEVASLFRHLPTKVIPLRFDWSVHLIEELRTLPSGTQVTFALDKSECADFGDSLIRELSQLCPELHVQVSAYKDSKNVTAFLRSGKHHRILVTGVSGVRQRTQNTRVIVQSVLEINKQSTEEARIQAGIIL